MSPTNPPQARHRVLLSAGEASGDNYGAMLIPELKKLLGDDTEFFGVGGEKMRAAGFETIVDSNRVAAVGITEVIKHVLTIYREFFRSVAAARQRKPDLAVLIDFPDFNLRLAGKLHQMGLPVVYFVSPQLWAWKQRRIWRVRKFVDRMLVIFPFEEAYYRERDVEARYVGHPLADLPLPQIPREEFARRFKVDATKPWIALLPGSRKREVALNLPTMIAAAQQLGSEYEFLVPVASTLSRDWVGSLIPEGRASIHLVDDARAALLHSRAAVVASGTATVEAALIGNPFIVVYRVSRLTYAIGKRLVKLKNYGMVNLIAGREIVPELIQDDFTADAVVRHVRELVEDGPAHQQMIRNLQAVATSLRHSSSAGGAIAEAAREIAALVSTR